MTVCIASMAEDGKSAVLVSDKMVSKQSPLVEYEHDIEKIVKIFDNFYVLLAGNVNNATDIIDYARTKIKEGSSPQKKFETMRDAYISIRKEKVEDAILKKHGFSGVQDFLAKQKNLAPDICNTLHNLIGNANLQTIMTLVAIDDGQCYLKILNHPGELINPLEYATTGSGEMHAAQSLIGAKYSKKEDIDTATYLVYEAKRRSEVAPGVGHLTEMIIIRNVDGSIEAKQLDDDDIKKLSEVYDEVNLRDTDKIKELLKEKGYTS